MNIKVPKAASASTSTMETDCATSDKLKTAAKHYKLAPTCCYAAARLKKTRHARSLEIVLPQERTYHKENQPCIHRTQASDTCTAHGSTASRHNNWLLADGYHRHKKLDRMGSAHHTDHAATQVSSQPSET